MEIGRKATATAAEAFYFVSRNSQGDIVSLYSSATGAKVGTYTYDSWGKITATTDTSGISIMTKNPFRYRGYYYDTETGWYYLQSRYYDPAVKRFINADVAGIIGASPDSATIDKNLFAYCDNNPVVRSDPAGYAWWHWAIAGAVVVACAVATVATAGGFGLALGAVASVGSGIAAGSTAATMAAGAFIGSSAAFGLAATTASVAASANVSFNDLGNWGTVGGTALGGAGGAAAGLAMAKSQQAPASPISSSDAKRIQNAANKTDQTITVVGSRANGTAGLNSDWDYIMSGNSAQRHAAASSVPRGVWGGANNTGIDIFSSYPYGPNPVVLDTSLPYVTFYPQ